jgi:hypothetical protein
MKSRLTSVATMALLGVLVIPLGLSAQNAALRCCGIRAPIGRLARPRSHSASSLTRPASGYQIISLDAPGAGTSNNANTTGIPQGTGCFGCTFAINRWGAVAGTYLDANNVFHGFVRSPDGKFTIFEAPGADTNAQDYNGTVAQGINDFGEITGYWVDKQDIEHGFVRSPWGTFTNFDTPGAIYGPTPLFINLEGAVVGYAFDANTLFHAFVRYPDGTLTLFAAPDSCTGGTGGPGSSGGCYGQEATYVNLGGDSVGNFEDDSGNFVSHGMIRSPGGRFTIFDAPNAGTGQYQGTGCPGCNMGVNYSGAIAGSTIDGNDVFHGFLRSPDGKFITFEATGAGTAAGQGTGCFSDCPMSLNDSGEITGSYWDSDSVQHGFVRTPEGSFVTIDPEGSVGTQPESINESGTIVGYYVDANVVYHGFIATPITNY